MPNFEIDETDRRILAALQSDGRMTNQDLSQQVGLSPSPCLRRVRLLEEAGIISKYVALISADAVSLNVTAFIRVRLASQDDKHLAQFEETIAGFPEVMECYLMTGDSDYQLRVVVGSLSEFEDFLRQRLTRIPAVAQVTTSFALRPTVYRTALPVTSATSKREKGTALYAWNR